MELYDALVVRHGVTLCDEGGPHCGLGEFVEFVMCKPRQNTTLSYTTVTNSNGLDLKYGLLAGHSYMVD